MMQADFSSWTYAQQPQQPPILPPHPALPMHPVPAGAIGPPHPHWTAPHAPGMHHPHHPHHPLGGPLNPTTFLKTSPLGGPSDLHPLDHPGAEPTFQDEMTGLFVNDSLLFSDEMSSEEAWQQEGSGASGSGETAIGGGGTVHGSCATILDLAPASVVPGLGSLAAPVLGAPVGIGHMSAARVPPGPSALGVAMPSSLRPAAATIAPVASLENKILVAASPTAAATAAAGVVAPMQVQEPKISGEASGSGSGEASADEFNLPLSATEDGLPGANLVSELASPSPIKSVLGGAPPAAGPIKAQQQEEEEEEEEDDDDEGSSDEEHAGPRSLHAHRMRLSHHHHHHHHPRGGFAAARQQQATPLSSSGHSAGRSYTHTQPSTSRGHIVGAQGSSGSALGKRGSAAADLAGDGSGKRGGRRRVMSRRAAAAAFDDISDDEEDDVQYRSAVRRAAAAAAAAAGAMGGAAGVPGAAPARTSTRLQVRPTPYRLDSDYVTYDDVEEPSSPTTAAHRKAAAAAAATGGTAPRGRGRLSSVTAAATTTHTLARRTPAPSRAGRRTVPLAAQRIRATSARHELKGRPSFAEIVEAGFMIPGPHRFSVGNVEVAAAVGEDGAIMYAGTRYRAISKFALVVLRERNPTRQSCDGWKEVTWNGEKLDALRVRVQAHARQVARQRVQ